MLQKCFIIGMGSAYRHVGSKHHHWMLIACYPAFNNKRLGIA
jgi:hypothetical protein